MGDSKRNQMCSLIICVVEGECVNHFLVNPFPVKDAKNKQQQKIINCTLLQKSCLDINSRWEGRKSVTTLNFYNPRFAPAAKHGNKEWFHAQRICRKYHWLYGISAWLPPSNEKVCCSVDSSDKFNYQLAEDQQPSASCPLRHMREKLNRMKDMLKTFICGEISYKDNTWDKFLQLCFQNESVLSSKSLLDSWWRQSPTILDRPNCLLSSPPSRSRFVPEELPLLQSLDANRTHLTWLMNFFRSIRTSCFRLGLENTSMETTWGKLSNIHTQGPSLQGQTGRYKTQHLHHGANSEQQHAAGDQTRRTQRGLLSKSTCWLIKGAVSDLELKVGLVSLNQKVRSEEVLSIFRTIY